MSGNGGDKKDKMRLLMVKLDRKTGRLSVDRSFREPGAADPGISFDRPNWPHGNNGPAIPHGSVFSRQ